MLKTEVKLTPEQRKQLEVHQSMVAEATSAGANGAIFAQVYPDKGKMVVHFFGHETAMAVAEVVAKGNE